jgi:hypothetical protein
VKTRAIQLLIKLSDFQSILNDPKLQESIAIAVFKIFSSEETQDLCLKMTCGDYMKNFYNDHAFKVTTYAHLLPAVLEMGNHMLSKCAGNMEAINEILDLFRFVIDKYAAVSIVMTNGQTANEYLVSMLVSQWSLATNEFFSAV